MLNNFGKGKLQ